ncbi:MAG: ATP-binding cassette domain-containing protein [Lachnospiraceae bacterium]|nr:ATP-binding cassette domain-containing protein [Lachnospiraceae bacterium]
MRLEIRKVTKRFGDVIALDDLSVTFEEGIYGILGANGAGKSTMISLITDNIKRDAGKEGGEILYNGVDILKLGSEYRSLIGYMPQQQGFYEDFSPVAFLKYMAVLKGIPKKQANKQIDELLDIVNLTEKRYEKIGTFSGGMKQRVLLAQALLGEPRILILDEPTAGLDPKERIAIRNYISELSKNRIILFATHVVSDIECIADKVLIMRKGKLIALDSPQGLIQKMHNKVSEIICLPDEVKEIQKKYRVGNIRQRKEGLTLRVVGDNLPEKFERLNDSIDLEDVYLYYVE